MNLYPKKVTKMVHMIIIRHPAHGGQLWPLGFIMCKSEAEAIVLTETHPTQAMTFIREKSLAVMFPTRNRDNTICLRPSSAPKTEKKATGITPRRVKKKMVRTEVPKLSPHADIPRHPKENAEMTMLLENHIVAAFIMSVSSFSFSVTGSIPFVSAFTLTAKRLTHESLETSVVVV